MHAWATCTRGRAAEPRRCQHFPRGQRGWGGKKLLLGGGGDAGRGAVVWAHLLHRNVHVAIKASQNTLVVHASIELDHDGATSHLHKDNSVSVASERCQTEPPPFLPLFPFLPTNPWFSLLLAPTEMNLIRHRKCGFLGGFLGPACAWVSGLNAVLLPSHTLLLHSLPLASTSLSCVGPRAPIWRGECSAPKEGVRFQPILTAFRNSVGDFFACSVLILSVYSHSPLWTERQTDRFEYFSAAVQVQIVDQPLSKKDGLPRSRG